MRAQTHPFPEKVIFPGDFRVPQGAGAEPKGRASSGAGRLVRSGAGGAPRSRAGGPGFFIPLTGNIEQSKISCIAFKSKRIRVF